MATNQDFNDLIVRIDTATDALEVNVLELQNATTDVQESVTQAQTAATTATQQATIATNKATEASTSATTATNKANEAIQAVEDAKALAPFDEAPKDGNIYGRKDGDWSIVGSGEGVVTSVNDITPDATGNVTLPIPEQVNSDWNATTGKAQILNKPTLFSGNYNDLTNKPTIPTKTSDLTNDSGYIDDAPNDGKQYARKSAAWVEVAASGGYDVANPFPTVLFTYADATTTVEEGITFTKLSEVAARAGLTRPFGANTAVPLNMFYKTASAPRYSRTHSTRYNALFSRGDKLGIAGIPAGLYEVSPNDFISPIPFAGKAGILEIKLGGKNPALTQVTFYEFTYSTGTTPTPANNKIYRWMPYDGTSGNESMWSST